MKRFKFKLEIVLTERKRIEDMKLKDWTLAQQILMNMKDELRAMETRLELAFDEANQLAALPVNNPANFISMDSFISGTKTKIGWKKQEIVRAEKLTERTRQAYVQARQKREAIEKFKERKLAEYRAGIRKQEIKALDDIYIMSGAARRRADREDELA